MNKLYVAMTAEKIIVGSRKAMNNLFGKNWDIYEIFDSFLERCPNETGYTLEEFDKIRQDGIIVEDPDGDFRVFKNLEEAIKEIGYDPTNPPLDEDGFVPEECEWGRYELTANVRYIYEAPEEKPKKELDPYDDIFADMPVERGTYNTGW